jgi:hypothetical protein
MDSLIAAASRALNAGDALSALKRVALRNDPPALAMRGIAMAQLGEYARARELLRRAAKGFGAAEPLARARCVVADAEVAVAMRDFGGSPRTLMAAAAILQKHGDHANAVQARLIAARRLLLLGRLEEAAIAIADVDTGRLPPSLSAIAELTAAELALRSLQVGTAEAALRRARLSAERAEVPALIAEVAEAGTALVRPAARRIGTMGERDLRLVEVAALLGSRALIVDACRRGIRAGPVWIPLTSRPILFELARVLAEAWPNDVPREILIARAFRVRRPNESHRARLRVEIGRLRALLTELAQLEASPAGFALKARDSRDIVVLAPPIDGDQASLLALLADGVAWSTSSLALALGASQRTVQRALVELEAAGRVRSIERARARRWLTPPLSEFTTILLLPVSLPFE